MFWCFERKKPQVRNGMRDEGQVPVVSQPDLQPSQIFPKGYQETTLARFRTMKVGEGLLSGQTRGHIAWYVNQAKAGRTRYNDSSLAIKAETGWNIPWEVIATVHGLEASFDFRKQILNGQPYTKKTTWVPKNLGPWPTWEASTSYGFKHESTHNHIPTTWGVVETALFFERWNGMGYWRMGKPSPYLWSYTSVQEAGKYVSDGRYSSTAVSKQVGAMALLDTLGFFTVKA